MHRIVVALLVAVSLSLSLVLPVAADPVNNPYADQPHTLLCTGGGQIQLLTSFGLSNASAINFVTDSSSPERFVITGYAFDGEGGTIGQGNRTGLQGRIISCSGPFDGGTLTLVGFLV